MARTPDATNPQYAAKKKHSAAAYAADRATTTAESGRPDPAGAQPADGESSEDEDPPEWEEEEHLRLESFRLSEERRRNEIEALRLQDERLRAELEEEAEEQARARRLTSAQLALGIYWRSQVAPAATDIMQVQHNNPDGTILFTNPPPASRAPSPTRPSGPPNTTLTSEDHLVYTDPRGRQRPVIWGPGGVALTGPNARQAPAERPTSSPAYPIEGPDGAGPSNPSARSFRGTPGVDYYPPGTATPKGKPWATPAMRTIMGVDLAEIRQTGQLRPSNERLQELADQFGVTYDRVDNWFEEQRRKSRRNSGAPGPGPSRSSGGSGSGGSGGSGPTGGSGGSAMAA